MTSLIRRENWPRFGGVFFCRRFDRLDRLDRFDLTHPDHAIPNLALPYQPFDLKDLIDLSNRNKSDV